MVENHAIAAAGLHRIVSGARITVLPLIKSAEELQDLVARMAWGIGLASFRDCTVFLADSGLAGAEWRVPELMDPAIAANFPALRPRLRLVPSPSKSELLEQLEASDFVVFAEDPPQWGILTAEEWETELRRKKILRSDPARTRQEFGNWVELNFQLRVQREAEIEQSRTRFLRMLEETGRAGTAFCLATGPSLAAFKETNFDGAISIVCNSAILDEELMEWVRPRFLVFADPIFHFGPSKYAAEFRRRLRESCARHDYTIIVPMRYFGLLTDAMPELSDRTVGIPSDKPNGFNLDLSGEFRVFTTANILTYLMLPVASTFARKIYVLGCDGRPLDESGYFWQHNKKTQINDQMENIRLVHPGFFAIDYNDYYLDHCRQLEELIADGEKMGREYGTVTPSFIPALQNRPANLPRMLVIDFTEIGAQNATGQLKAALFKKWPAEKILQLRPLSTRDGSLFRLHSQAPHPGFKLAKLTREDALRECADFDPQIIYFRPTDSPPEFFELGCEIVRRLGVPVVTHIMDDWPERLRVENPALFARIEPALKDVIAGSAVRLGISDAMSAAYRERYGVDFIPVANGVEPADWLAPPPDRAADQPLVVRYCGGLTEDMTLASVEMVARAIADLGQELPIRFEIYALPAAIKTAQERFGGIANVAVLPAVEWTEYPNLLSTAGALLIAYNFDERTRIYTQFSMANKLPECFASGAPLIIFGPETIATVRRAVELGAAVAVTQPDAEALKKELRRLVREPASFRERALAARERALAEWNLDGVRRQFQSLIAPLDSRGPVREKTLLGPYTRLQSRRLDDCEAAAEFFKEATFSGATKVAIAFGGVPADRLGKFLERGWKAVSCPVISNADRHLSTLMPDFGKNAVAVVLCNAADLENLPRIPLSTAATLVFVEDGGVPRLAAWLAGHPAIRAIWSGHYGRLAPDLPPDYLMLREVADVSGDFTAHSPGTLVLLDPEWIKVRRGGDAVISLRKAWAAAMDAQSLSEAAVAPARVSERLLQWLRAWTAAIARLNVRRNLSQFFKDRAAELREIFPSANRGRPVIWK